MIIDWQASKEEWIDNVRSTLIPRLRADRRLVGSDSLQRHFDTSVEYWRQNGDFRAVINDGNELCAAAAILGCIHAEDLLLYEPRLAATRKSIDFCVVLADGTRAWIDMKTVAPKRQDDKAAWERLCKIAQDFPPTATLIAGAAIGSQLLKARWSFVQRAAELEAKIALLTEGERGPVRLLFCSEGAWQEDDLEDFADFYRSGAFRPDDWAQNAVARYMAEKNLTFDGSIAGFCYLERRHDEVGARRFTIDAKGPQMFAHRRPDAVLNG